MCVWEIIMKPSMKYAWIILFILILYDACIYIYVSILAYDVCWKSLIFPYNDNRYKISKSDIRFWPIFKTLWDVVYFVVKCHFIIRCLLLTFFLLVWGWVLVGLVRVFTIFDKLGRQCIKLNKTKPTISVWLIRF